MWECISYSECFKTDTVKTGDEAKLCLMSFNVMDPTGKNRPIEACNSHLVFSHSIVAACEHIACNKLIEDESKSAGEPSGV